MMAVIDQNIDTICGAPMSSLSMAQQHNAFFGTLRGGFVTEARSQGA